MSDENKFNFSEEEVKKEQTVEQSKEAVKKDAQGLLKSIKTFFSELLDFRDDTDRDATIAAIKGDIPFKGRYCLDFSLFYFCRFHWFKCQLNSCGNWSHVNFTTNGTNFRCWAFYCN